MIDIIKSSFKKNESDTWILFTHFFAKLEEYAQYYLSDDKISDKQKCIKLFFIKIHDSRNHFDIYEAFCSK